MRPLGAGGHVAITADAVGGVWRYATDVGRGLIGAGLRASLIGLGPAPSAGQRAEAADAGLELVWLDAPLEWTLTEAGEAAELAARLYARAEAEGAALVHLNAPLLAGAFAEGPPLPTVVAAHSCLTTWWRAVRGGALPPAWALHHRLTARGLRRAEVAVAPSAAFAADLVAAYGPLPALRVVHNSAHPVRPQPRAAFVLAVGRWWDAGKNLAALDAAAASIHWPVLAAGPEVGPGAERMPAEHVQFLGALEPAELADLMGRTPIFVALPRYEPFGLAVLEAATAGAALVLSDIPTFRELWDGAALFVDPLDPADTARAVNGLIADRRLRQRLGTAARRRSGAFTLDRQLAGLFGAYGRALGGADRQVRSAP